MKRFVTTTLLAAGLLAAAQTTTTAKFGTIGIWPLCEAGVDMGGLCNGFTPGHEEYQLLVHTSDRYASAYDFTVAARYVAGGSVSITGTADRLDNATGETSILLDFGGVVESDPVVTVRAR